MAADTHTHTRTHEHTRTRSDTHTHGRAHTRRERERERHRIEITYLRKRHSPLKSNLAWKIERSLRSALLSRMLQTLDKEENFVTFARYLTGGPLAASSAMHISDHLSSFFPQFLSHNDSSCTSDLAKATFLSRRNEHFLPFLPHFFLLRRLKFNNIFVFVRAPDTFTRALAWANLT